MSKQWGIDHAVATREDGALVLSRTLAAYVPAGAVILSLMVGGLCAVTLLETATLLRPSSLAIFVAVAAGEAIAVKVLLGRLGPRSVEVFSDGLRVLEDDGERNLTVEDVAQVEVRPDLFTSHPNRHSSRRPTPASFATAYLVLGTGREIKLAGGDIGDAYELAVTICDRLGLPPPLRVDPERWP